MSAPPKLPRLELQPITFAEAARFVHAHHRHHPPQISRKFGAAVNDGDHVVGVVMVGRPIARLLDDDYTAEVTRLCTADFAPPNTASKLLAAAWRAARALGYRRLITYTLASESGSSLRAAGFRELYSVRARSWHNPSRPRVDKHDPAQRTLWECVRCPPPEARSRHDHPLPRRRPLRTRVRPHRRLPPRRPRHHNPRLLARAMENDVV